MKNSNKKLVVLSILFTPNNILYSVTQLNGDILFWTSSGTKKVKGTKKITSTSITSTIKYITSFICNFRYVYVKVRGFGKTKKTVIKQLKQSFLNILLISDETAFPHNGCKQSKIRRI